MRDKYTSTVEVFCNKIAGEIIAPTDLFIHYWEETYNDLYEVNEKIDLIANDFKVSKLVVARKALSEKYIDQKNYLEIAAIVKEEFELSKQINSERSGGHPVFNVVSRLDHHFLRTLISHVESAQIQYTNAYRLAGVGRGVFEDIVEYLKGVR